MDEVQNQVQNEYPVVELQQINNEDAISIRDCQEVQEEFKEGHFLSGILQQPLEDTQQIPIPVIQLAPPPQTISKKQAIKPKSKPLRILELPQGSKQPRDFVLTSSSTPQYGPTNNNDKSLLVHGFFIGDEKPRLKTRKNQEDILIYTLESRYSQQEARKEVCLHRETCCHLQYQMPNYKMYTRRAAEMGKTGWNHSLQDYSNLEKYYYLHQELSLSKQHSLPECLTCGVYQENSRYRLSPIAKDKEETTSNLFCYTGPHQSSLRIDIAKAHIDVVEQTHLCLRQMCFTSDKMGVYEMDFHGERIVVEKRNVSCMGYYLWDQVYDISVMEANGRSESMAESPLAKMNSLELGVLICFSLSVFF